MNISLVDATGPAGNLDSLSKDINEELAQQVSAAEGAQNKKAQTVVQDDDEDAALPPRMRGKSRKEIADMYANLESSHGRMANELGTQRNLTDRLLDLKRTTDLGTNTPKAKISRDEILSDDPTTSIERIIDARLKPLTEAIDQRLAQVVATSSEQSFVTKHPDYNAIASDPEFAKWIGGSNLRIRAAQAAKGGDWAQADDLLTEYKAGKKKQVVTEDSTEVDLEGARNAGFESGSGVVQDTGRKAGKIYSRAALIKLRMDDPEKYYSDDFQTVILKAYAEKRVKD